MNGRALSLANTVIIQTKWWNLNVFNKTFPEWCQIIRSLISTDSDTDIAVHERILCLAAGAVKLFLCPSTLTGNSPYLHKRKPTHTHTLVKTKNSSPRMVYYQNLSKSPRLSFCRLSPEVRAWLLLTLAVTHTLFHL